MRGGLAMTVEGDRAVQRCHLLSLLIAPKDHGPRVEVNPCVKPCRTVGDGREDVSARVPPYVAPTDNVARLLTEQCQHQRAIQFTDPRAPSHSPPTYWSVGAATIIDADMGEHTEQRIAGRPRIARRRLVRQTPELIARRLLEIAVYGKRCSIGSTLTLDDLAETEVGDWKMPDFRMACAYAASRVGCSWRTIYPR